MFDANANVAIINFEEGNFWCIFGNRNKCKKLYENNIGNTRTFPSSALVNVYTPDCEGYDGKLEINDIPNTATKVHRVYRDYKNKNKKIRRAVAYYGVPANTIIGICSEEHMKFVKEIFKLLGLDKSVIVKQEGLSRTAFTPDEFYKFFENISHNTENILYDPKRVFTEKKYSFFSRPIEY